jgi:hypothetical protein
MAGIFRGQASAIARAFALLPALLFAVVTTPSAIAQLSEQPMLVVDPGMHTAEIKDLAVDAAGVTPSLVLWTRLCVCGR